MNETTTTPKRTTKPASVGALIDAMWGLREAKREVESRAKALSEQIGELEATLLEAMDKEGVLKSTGTKASAGITTSIRPDVVDWDVFYAYIGKHKYFHLLERRPSVTGCRELFETKGKVPGVEPFTKRSINLRTV